MNFGGGLSAIGGSSQRRGEKNAGFPLEILSDKLDRSLAFSGVGLGKRKRDRAGGADQNKWWVGSGQTEGGGEGGWEKDEALPKPRTIPVMDGNAQAFSDRGERGLPTTHNSRSRGRGLGVSSWAAEATTDRTRRRHSTAAHRRFIPGPYSY